MSLTRSTLATMALLVFVVALAAIVFLGGQIPTQFGTVGNDIHASGSCCDMPAPPSGEPQP